MATNQVNPYIWRILLIDDDEDDYFLTRELLAASRKWKFILEWVPSYSTGKQALLTDTYDAILVDYDLGIHTGTHLIKEFIALGCTAPFILLTGRGSYDVDLEAMESGASDYLSKSEVNASILERSIRYAIEQKRIEDQLRKTNDELQQERSRLKAIIDSAPSGIIQLDKDGNYVLLNRAVENMFLGELTGAVSDPVEKYTFFCSDGAPMTFEDLPYVRSLQSGALEQNVEIKVQFNDGKSLSLLVNSSPLYDHQENISGSVAVLSDITELRKLETQQLETQARMEVQRRLMQHREMERMEIARDLHDGPIQDLLAINMSLAEMATSSTANDYRESAQAVREKLQEQIHELRQFCHELRPPALAPFGLEKAIRSHISTFEERNPDIDVQLELDADRKILSEDARMAVFRVYQELLNNISKHAKAKSISISLDVNPEDVSLTVKDDGVGFKVPTNWIVQARSGHLGLIGIRERVEAIGGILTIDSIPGSGTQVKITVPLEQKSLEALII